ncbi:MAG: hypothetical protein MZV64_73640 [Ignavibacteriales bacterium]|nr:hypothetical protein [Ignavibacteriales bacterium]
MDAHVHPQRRAHGQVLVRPLHPRLLRAGVAREADAGGSVRDATPNTETGAQMKPMIEVTVLGKPRFPSPIRRPISDSLRLPGADPSRPAGLAAGGGTAASNWPGRAPSFSSIRSRRARASSPAAGCAPA